MNSFDKTIKNPIEVDYNGIAQKLNEASARVGEFSYIFNQLASLVKVLEIKATISKKVRAAYQLKDNEKLTTLLCDFDELENRLSAFHEAFYIMWHKENKTFGWEIQDARLGGVIQRVKTCKRRISDYLSGRLESLEELEVELLAISEDSIYGNVYAHLISTSCI